MGFRNGSYATVWSVEEGTQTRTKVRLSISRKNRDTGEYEQDFSGFVDFVGTAAAQKALRLKEKDRIKIGDTDVTTYYNKEKNITYTNFKVFSFDTQESSSASGGNNSPAGSMYEGDPRYELGEDGPDEAMLPF